MDEEAADGLILTKLSKNDFVRSATKIFSKSKFNTSAKLLSDGDRQAKKFSN